MTKRERKPGLCPCGTAPRRLNQGYCHACHAQEQRIYRAKMREVIAAGRDAIQARGLAKINASLMQPIDETSGGA